MNLAALCAPAPGRQTRTAVCGGGVALDSAVLEERVGLLASRLSETPRQSLIGLRVGNAPAFLVAMLACLRARRATVLLDPLWTEGELSDALSRVELSMLVECDPAPGGGTATCQLDSAGRVLCFPDLVPASERFDLDAVAVVHWSSGSTGRPKPIAVSRSALEFRIASLIEAFTLVPEDRVLCIVPLSHCHGNDCIALPALAAGAELVLMDPLEATPSAVAERIAQRGITVFSALPRFYAGLLEQRIDPRLLRTLRLPLCGSAALDPQLAQRYAKSFGEPVRPGYGLTEVGVLSLDRHPDPVGRPGSVGSVLPGIEWRIHAPDDDGVGELWVRSPGCADGYLGETQEARLDDGWLRTQDLVRADASEQLFILGRTSAFINVNGAKADPREIERVIESLSWVVECAVTGIADDCGVESIRAVIVLDGEAAGERPEDAVREHVARELSIFKVPSLVQRVAALPRNSLGKLLYSQLPDPQRRSEPVGAAPPRGEIERGVAEIWCAVLQLESAGVDVSFADLGGHSVHLVQVLGRLRDRFQRDLTVADFFGHPTIASQAALLSGGTSRDPVEAAGERAARQRAALRQQGRRRADLSEPG